MTGIEVKQPRRTKFDHHLFRFEISDINNLCSHGGLVSAPNCNRGGESWPIDLHGFAAGINLGFFTPFSALGTDLYFKIHATSLIMSAFP